MVRTLFERRLTAISQARHPDYTPDFSKGQEPCQRREQTRRPTKYPTPPRGDGYLPERSGAHAHLADSNVVQLFMFCYMTPEVLKGWKRE